MMRNAAFFGLGLGLLFVQGTVYRVLDGLTLWGAVATLAVALIVDMRSMMRDTRSYQGPVHALRVDFVLPAAILLGYIALVSVWRAHATRPVPALVLPLILFIGVQDVYSLPRGAAVAFGLGYATDVFGIAPVGLYAFTYVATFVLARAAGVRIAAQTVWMQVVFAFAFALLEGTMVLVLLAIFGRDPWVPKCLYPLILTQAVATAAVAPAVFRMAQALQSALGITGATEGVRAAL